MTPEQEGSELLEKFKPLVRTPRFGKRHPNPYYLAKEAAILCVDKMIAELENLHKPEYTTFRMFDEKQMDGYELLNYYKAVKDYLTKQ